MAAWFFIAIDSTSETNGEGLDSALRNLGSVVRLTSSLLALYSTKPKPTIAQILLPVLGDEDRLFIIEALGGTTWFNLMSDDETMHRILAGLPL